MFFLLVYVFGRKDANTDWCYARCREVQASPNGYLDLWAREHYKSTIITYALTIQDILNDPEITIGIFSHTRPIAKAFMKQIKRELETNEHLKELFPEILYANPQRESSKWTEDEGIIVKRKSNPKEATIEAWGLVDGQPTSKHYSLMLYDDVVTRESVNTPEMIAKTTEAWELSDNLGAKGGVERYTGTRYHFNDSYKTIMARGVIPRIYPATEDGTVEGEPVMFTREELAAKRRKQGPYTFGCQMLQNPIADSTQGFKLDWLRYCEAIKPAKARETMNIYMLIDAASAKKKTSDYTAMWVWGAGSDHNLYLLDLVRDRLNLTERARRAISLHKKWQPLRVGYERYGVMADIEHIQDVQDRENYRFDITELGGQQPKEDRIRRLVPMWESGRVYIPKQLHKTNYEGKSVDVIEQFVNEEFEAFPVGEHDDMLDAGSRIFDLLPGGIEFPMEDDSDDWDDYETPVSWAAM